MLGVAPTGAALPAPIGPEILITEHMGRVATALERELIPKASPGMRAPKDLEMHTRLLCQSTTPSHLQ